MPRPVHVPRALATALALIAIALAPARVIAGPEATVVSVGDGDTLRVRKDGKVITVRLACIDAPETAQSSYGQQSRQYLQQRLPVGSAVRLDEKTTDRYGRLVAEVISEININLALVEDGQAFVFRQYLRGCNAKEYLDAEYRASRRRYGVWQVEGGITRPWDFRKGRSAAARSAPMPAPRTCCARGKPTSIATMTGKPANRCGVDADPGWIRWSDVSH